MIIATLAIERCPCVTECSAGASQTCRHHPGVRLSAAEVAKESTGP